MKRKISYPILQFILVLILISIACSTFQPSTTGTPEPTSTATLASTATHTPRPSPTPRPTWTPDRAATQHVEELDAEVQTYYEKGYLSTTDGIIAEIEDFRYEWAQLGWYKWLLLGATVSDFFMSAHFKWDSALKNSDIAGCGFVFGIQPNDDHYAVFLDRTKVYFLMRDLAAGFSKPITPTRGIGRVKFDYPAEADFTVIVKDAYAYVLVNGEVVGEYTLSRSWPSRGELGLTVLSGTNRDYGTRCEMTNLHFWMPND